MSTEKHKNIFKFGLYQGDKIFYEKEFNANDFNPLTRYSIDIRSILPKFMIRFQKILSKKYYNYDFNVGSGNFVYLKEKEDKIVNSVPKRYRGEIIYNPKNVEYKIENRTIKGVECKIGLYINGNHIVERLFYVDNFNPNARFSIELYYEFMNVVYEIYEFIKERDINNIWDDYYLINSGGYSINQIREMTPEYKKRILGYVR